MEILGKDSYWSGKKVTHWGLCGDRPGMGSGMGAVMSKDIRDSLCTLGEIRLEAVQTAWHVTCREQVTTLGQSDFP